MSRKEQVTNAVLNVNTCCIYIISTCYHVIELQEYFLCNLCNIFRFSGFTDQACEPIKIIPVIPIPIDFALAANRIKQKDEN